MPIIERRYAEALLNLSEKENDTVGYGRELGLAAQVFEENREFRQFMLNPRIRGEVKKELLKKLFADEAGTCLMNFLMLLTDNGRIRYLPGILKEFGKMAEKRRNILKLTVISAEPLEESRIKEIERKFLGIYKASGVRTETELDKGLIGGVVVKVGDRIVDGSVKGRLESLRELLIKD